MNNLTPLLPEARFKPLATARLDGMIDHALSFNQLPQQSNVISFRKSWAQNLAFGTGMAAMAASVLMAFIFTPQYTTSFNAVQSTASADVANSDVSDLLLLESFGA